MGQKNREGEKSQKERENYLGLDVELLYGLVAEYVARRFDRGDVSARIKRLETGAGKGFRGTDHSFPPRPPALRRAPPPPISIFTPTRTDAAGLLKKK